MTVQLVTEARDSNRDLVASASVAIPVLAFRRQNKIIKNKLGNLETVDASLITSVVLDSGARLKVLEGPKSTFYRVLFKSLSAIGRNQYNLQEADRAT